MIHFKYCYNDVFLETVACASPDPRSDLWVMPQLRGHVLGALLDGAQFCGKLKTPTQLTLQSVPQVWERAFRMCELEAAVRVGRKRPASLDWSVLQILACWGKGLGSEAKRHVAAGRPGVGPRMCRTCGPQRAKRVGLGRGVEPLPKASSPAPYGTLHPNQDQQSVCIVPKPEPPPSTQKKRIPQVHSLLTRALDFGISDPEGGLAALQARCVAWMLQWVDRLLGSRAVAEALTR
eukprot:332972-Chlamydomonas_euryale.AAC.1